MSKFVAPDAMRGKSLGVQRIARRWRRLERHAAKRALAQGEEPAPSSVIGRPCECCGARRSKVVRGGAVPAPQRPRTK